MRTAICYKFVLGSTKKYATWLSEDLQASLFTFDEVDTATLDLYDIVIILSGTYAMKMPLVNFLEKYWEVLQTKKLVVVAVGMVPSENEESKKSYEVIPEQIRNKIHYNRTRWKSCT
jgi:menaquinone-dependent protoporphyrinogen IX oxidase